MSETIEKDARISIAMSETIEKDVRISMYSDVRKNIYCIARSETTYRKGCQNFYGDVRNNRKRCQNVYV